MDLLASGFLGYAVLMIFSPGPSNVSASALGSKIGFGRTLPFMLGMAAGFFAVLLVAGLMSDFIRTQLDANGRYLKWLGAAYLLWLAVSLFLPERKTAQRDVGPGFVSGFLMVLVNPKGVLFAITTYSAFGELIGSNALRVAASALLMAAMSLAATSLWALTGQGFTTLFKNEKFGMAFRIAMAAFLVYSAYSIVMH